jgi:hypothetical protein
MLGAMRHGIQEPESALKIDWRIDWRIDSLRISPGMAERRMVCPIGPMRL